MDTVQEETISNGSDSVMVDTSLDHRTMPSQPPSRRMTGDSLDMEGLRHISNSRRPSIIIAALRRPSQALALSAAHTVMNQRRMVIDLLQTKDKEKEHIQKNRRLGYDALTVALSALYAKLIVVLGIAFPITEIISTKVPPHLYKGFFLYLYSGSVLFVVFIYATLLREKITFYIQNSAKHKGSREIYHPKKDSHTTVRYGSFYLRLGAIAFGIGSMVYSGLDFGQYFELRKEKNCDDVLIALTPAARTVLTILQMQFIFLNSKEMELNRYKIVARFGTMHMIATNLCEWLYVLVEETKHEIIHITHKPLFAGLERQSFNNTNVTSQSESSLQMQNNVTRQDMLLYECKRTNIMGSLVQNVSPFLFPCTIEYSLICAVILFEMWKNVKRAPKNKNKNKNKKNIKTPPVVLTPPNAANKSRSNSITQEKLAQHFSLLFNGRGRRSSHHFSVDCSGAHRGLFAGILVIVMTIISLIMFFVLNEDPSLNSAAIWEVNICELILYVLTSFAVVAAMYQMRDLKYHKKNGASSHSLGLDTTLLVMAQTGVFIYSMFSIIGCHFTLADPQGSGHTGLVAELFSLMQTVLQTQFVLDAWWRRCRSAAQARRKPGRQLVTFLLVANMALWTINSLEKNRAEFRPSHLKFFGVWAWTTITHVSMPLVIFYRFHSSICLFEIWKTGYKMKMEYH